MGQINIQTATVYFAPTKGRRYLTKRAAAFAEAGALVEKKYPYYLEEEHWSSDNRLVSVRDRLARRILKSLKQQVPSEPNTI